MKVVEYLKQYGLEKLSDEYGIRVKKYDDEGLVVLNYNGIYSEVKFIDIVKECRGLILDFQFNIVSRSFDRFYNYGESREHEALDTRFDSLKVYEKIDGSLIKIYNYRDFWYVSTRGTAFAEASLNDYDENLKKTTFKDLVFKSLDMKDETSFQNFCNEAFKKSHTYIFELTSPENRIVVPYEGCTLWFLVARRNSSSGTYEQRPDKVFSHSSKIRFPRSYKFTSLRECIESVENLREEEGYVLYNDLNAPVCKIKSPTYVQSYYASKNLTTKKILELIATGECDEFLNYHPEKKCDFEPYLTKIDSYLQEASRIYEKYKNIRSDKVFAQKMKYFTFSWIAFRARKSKKSLMSAYRESDVGKKMNFLTKHVLSPKVILCVGISGSGKSTAASKYVENAGFVNINRDDVRFALFPGSDWSNYKFTKAKEELVTRECDKIWNEAKSQRKNVIVSDCNLKQEYQILWKSRTRANNYEFEVKYFPISIEEAWKRDLRRGGRAVGREVIIRQYQKWLKITNQPTYRPDKKKPKAIICDVDGTIAIPTKRSFYDYSNVSSDKPREVTIEMLVAWATNKKYAVVFVSGRQDCCQFETIEWITKHVPVQEFCIHMRKTGDLRKDRIVKEEIFWREIAPYYNVVAVIDDRPQVVRLWNDLGIEVFNVQRGYHEF